MKSTFKIFKILLLLCVVLGADKGEVKSVSVMEGDSVTLNPDLKEFFFEIWWWFGEPGLKIAQIEQNKTSFPNEGFKRRLQMTQTGSLTIKNMRINHTGLYKLKINDNSGISYKKFDVTVYGSPSVISGGEAEMKSLLVIKGKPVTLHVPEINGNELIVWRFGDEGKLIAKADIEAKSQQLYDDERFRERLKLDHQTGSLTVTNTKTTDSGHYAVKISSNKQTSYKRFTVTVSDPGLPVGAVVFFGIVFVLLLVAGVLYFLCRPITSDLSSKTLDLTDGEDCCLNPDTKIQTGDEIEWLKKAYIGVKDTLIAEMKRGKTKITECDVIFKDRLELDMLTGKLTIRNIRTEYTGNYILKIIRGRKTLYRKFYVSVRENILSVNDGDEVRLKTGAEIQTDDEVKWRFESYILAELKGKIVVTHDGPDMRFKDRLTVDKENGNLIIKDIRLQDSGEYFLEIRDLSSSRETIHRRYTVYFKVENKIVTLKECVTLNPNNEMRSDEINEIQWMFNDEEEPIAQMMGQNKNVTYAEDIRFKTKLQLDKISGSLTIKSIENEHVGYYKLKMCSSTAITKKTFRVALHGVNIVLVMDGDEVRLNTEIQPDDEIEWLFGTEKSPIAEIKRGIKKTHGGRDGRFKDRLKLDKTTGSLTISNIRPIHDGVYRIKINGRKVTSKNTFIVTVTVRPLSVMEGDDVFIDTFTKIQEDDLILWMFGDKDNLIAQKIGKIENTFGGPDEIFRDKLILDQNTGSLTIKNSIIKHSGLYKLQISSHRGTKYRENNVKIHGADGQTPGNNMEKKEERRMNESATVVMPLLNGEDLDEVNDQEGMSSL